MTTTLTHPPAEDLGRFIEGTLDDSGRAVVVEHIADCDDCRIIVVDATAFEEESAAKPRVASARWMAIAATVALALGGGVFVINATRDQLAPAIETSSGLPSPVEAQLSGFKNVPRVTNRGEQETDPRTIPLEIEVAKLLDRRGSDAKTLHAVGVANLFDASLVKVEPQADAKERQDASDRIKSDRAKAVQDLRAAAEAAPDNARYLSDLQRRSSRQQTTKTCGTRWPRAIKPSRSTVAIRPLYSTEP